MQAVAGTPQCACKMASRQLRSATACSVSFFTLSMSLLPSSRCRCHLAHSAAEVGDLGLLALQRVTRVRGRRVRRRHQQTPRMAVLRAVVGRKGTSDACQPCFHGLVSGSRVSSITTSRCSDIMDCTVTKPCNQGIRSARSKWCKYRTMLAAWMTWFTRENTESIVFSRIMSGSRVHHDCIPDHARRFISITVMIGCDLRQRHSSKVTATS